MQHNDLPQSDHPAHPLASGRSGDNISPPPTVRGRVRGPLVAQHSKLGKALSAHVGRTRPVLTRHPYELFLHLEEIEHRTTKVKCPQSNPIVERVHRTLLDEHYRVEGRRTWFETIDEMQIALGAYMIAYNTRRPHQGRNVNGRTPQTAFTEGLYKPTKTTR